MPETSLRELKEGFRQIRIEFDGLKETFAACRRVAACREAEYQLAAQRFETALIRYADTCRKAGFRQHQPRWPKNSGELGGRWSGDAGTGSDRDTSQTTDLSAVRRKPPMPGLPVHPPPFSSSGPAAPPEPVTIVNNAQTGFSTIDETTERLRTILENVVNGRPQGFGKEYGSAVHYDFANAVRSKNLRGIEVEQSFNVLDPDVQYGKKESVRTDVVLRNDSGEVTVIYDVKTGGASLDARRVQELRDKTGAGPRIPIIEMHVQRGLSLKGEAAKPRYVWIITLSLWDSRIQGTAHLGTGENGVSVL